MVRGVEMGKGGYSVNLNFVQAILNEMKNKSDVQVLIFSVLIVILWRFTLYIVQIQRIKQKEMHDIDVERLRLLLFPLQTLITRYISTKDEKIREESLSLIAIHRWLASDELELLIDQWIAFTNYQTATKLQRRISNEIKNLKDQLQISRNDYQPSFRFGFEVIDGIGIFYHSLVISIGGAFLLLFSADVFISRNWVQKIIFLIILAAIEIIVLFFHFRHKRKTERKTLTNSIKDEAEDVFIIGK